MQMNPNNRNVRLQQHVVLLTVMGRAGDLINKNGNNQGVRSQQPYKMTLKLYFFNIISFNSLKMNT